MLTPTFKSTRHSASTKRLTARTMVALVMSAMKKAVIGLSHSDIATRRPSDIAEQHEAQTDKPIACSTHELPPSSEWAQLPTELLLLVVSYTSFSVVLRAARINRRLYQLVVQPGVDAPGHVSMWHRYAPVTITITERIHGGVVEERAVQVNDERFECSRHHIERCVSSLLFLLRHIVELYFVYRRPKLSLRSVGASNTDTLFFPLQRFKQLRSLVVRGAPFIAAKSLAAALDSLPTLTCLELDADDTSASEELTAALHRLCSTQLDHLTVTSWQAHRSLLYQPTFPMRRLRSLAVTPTESSIHARLLLPYADDVPSLIGRFPSLLHLAVSCEERERMFEYVAPCRLSSFTVHAGRMAASDLDSIRAHTLCRICPDDTPRSVFRDDTRRGLCSLSMQQLVITDRSFDTLVGDDTVTVFPPTHAAVGLSGLRYIQYMDGLALADLTYLLTPSSPPVFAAQLTQLALRVHMSDRAAAAALLPSLAQMYPSLTHVYVGVEGNLDGWLLDECAECAEWDAAVQSVRAAVGSAWCANVDDVIACREDVAWRRSMGLPKQR